MSATADRPPLAIGHATQSASGNASDEPERRWPAPNVFLLALPLIVALISERDILGRHLDSALGHRGYVWVTCLAIAVAAVSWSLSAIFWRVPSMTALALTLFAVTAYELLELGSWARNRSLLEDILESGWWCVPLAFIFWCRTACLTVWETHHDLGVSDHPRARWGRHVVEWWLTRRRITRTPGHPRFPSLTWVELGIWLPLIAASVASLAPGTVYTIGGRSSSPWRSWTLTPAWCFYLTAAMALLVVLTSIILLRASYLARPDGLLPSVKRRARLAPWIVGVVGILVVLLFLSAKGLWPEPILDFVLSFYLGAYAVAMIDAAAMTRPGPTYSPPTWRTVSATIWAILIVVPVASLNSNGGLARGVTVFLVTPLLPLMRFLLPGMHGRDPRYDPPPPPEPALIIGADANSRLPRSVDGLGRVLVRLDHEPLDLNGITADDVKEALQLLRAVDVDALGQLIKVGAGHERLDALEAPLVGFISTFPGLGDEPSWEKRNRLLMELIYHHARLRREDHDTDSFLDPPRWTCCAGYLLVECVGDRLMYLDEETQTAEKRERLLFKLWSCLPPTTTRTWMSMRELPTAKLRVELSAQGAQTERQRQRGWRRRRMSDALDQLLVDWMTNLLDAFEALGE